MALVYGYQSYLGVKEEATWAESDNTISDWLHFRSESINRTDSRIRSEALTAKRTVRRAITGNTTVAGGVELETLPDNIGWLLKWALADKNKGFTTTATTGATGIYEHKIEVNELDQVGDLPSFRVLVGTSEFNKMNRGCKVNTLTITAGVNEILMASLDVIAKDQIRLPVGSPAYTPILSGLTPFVWKDGKLTAKFFKEGMIGYTGGTLDDKDIANWSNDILIGHINSFEISVANNLVGEKWYLGSGRTIDYLPVLKRDVTLSMEYEFNADLIDGTDKYEIYHYYTLGFPIRDLKLTFSSDVIVGAGIDNPNALTYELEICAGQFCIEEAPPEVGGPEILTQSISGTVEPPLWNTIEKPEITVRLRNTKSSYTI